MRLHTIRTIYFNIVPKIFITAGFILLTLSIGPLVKDEIWYRLKEYKQQKYVLSNSNENDTKTPDSIFARFLSTKPVSMEPVNREFGLVIEKIGVNAPVVPKVSVTDESKYKAALKLGVAHGFLSNYPSRLPGNTYLFAHASINFWDLGQYATTFNLLRKLDTGDRVHVFYKGETFVYEVINKETMKGWNTYPLTRPVIEPILTLQTCDPPGTTLNRLVVTAKLLEVKEN